MSEMTIAMVENNPVERKVDVAPYRHAAYKVCKNCGKMFVISDNDIVYYVDKFKSVPCRCVECRELNRKNNPVITENK